MVDGIAHWHSQMTNDWPMSIYQLGISLLTIVLVKSSKYKITFQIGKPTAAAAADSLLCQTMHKLSFHPMDNIYPHFSEIWKVDWEKYECYFHHQGYCGKMVRPENRNLISIVLARSPTLESKKPAVIVIGQSNYHHCNFRFWFSTTEPVLILG